MTRPPHTFGTPIAFMRWACRREPLRVRLLQRWQRWRRWRRLSPRQRRLWRYMASRDLGDPDDEWSHSWWDTFATEFWHQVFAYEHH